MPVMRTNRPTKDVKLSDGATVRVYTVLTHEEAQKLRRALYGDIAVPFSTTAGAPSPDVNFPIANVERLKDTMLEVGMASWDYTDEAGTPVPLGPETIGCLSEPDVQTLQAVLDPICDAAMKGLGEAKKGS